MIIIIGSPEEAHAKHIFNYLHQQEEEVLYLDSRQVPELVQFSWQPACPQYQGFITINSNKIPLEKLKSVYWRWYYGISIKAQANTPEAINIATIIQREVTSAVESFFTYVDCLWVNSYEAIQMHKLKPLQLNILAKNGIKVPQTLISSDPEEVVKFFEQNNKNIIYKPVRGGAHTLKLKEEDLSEERLCSLKASPVQFQEFVNGTDIRVYTFHDKLFAAEIRAKTVDFRDDPGADIVPVELPENIQQDCFKTLKLLKLNFSGIDIRRTPENEYFFIEANPAPMFMHFENMTGFPITETLVSILKKGKTNE